MSMYPYTKGEKSSPQFDFFAALMEGRVSYRTHTSNGETITWVNVVSAKDELEEYKVSAELRVKNLERDPVITKWRNEFEPPLKDYHSGDQRKIKEYLEAVEWKNRVDEEETM